MNFNKESADKAMTAVHAFADACGYRKGGQYTEPLETILVDLLAGLMHYCEREEQDFDRALSIATDHYSEERAS